jgi:hypothetical protein
MLFSVSANLSALKAMMTCAAMGLIEPACER